MAETADEYQILAIRERMPRPGEMVQVAQHLDLGVRRVGREQRPFGLADDEGHVAARDQVEFARPGRLGRAQHRRVVREFRAAAFAQVVQVHGVEHQLRLRRVSLRSSGRNSRST